jgi:hypothetical protein
MEVFPNRRDQLQVRYGQEDAPSVQQRSAKLKGSYRSIRSFAISRADGDVAPKAAVPRVASYLELDPSGRSPEI